MAIEFYISSRFLIAIIMQGAECIHTEDITFIL